MKQPARPSPDLLNNAVLYQIFLRAFTPEGTLAAAAGMLPHIKALGMDIVYLCPVAQADDDPRPEYWSVRQKASGMNNPRNPYRIKDYFAVDPEYGDDGDLRSFVDQAHGLGLRVLLDLVYLHCGPAAVFIEEHPDFVVRDEKGEIALGKWNFPLLNFESPALREYLWDNMEYFVREFNVDGYRCDVAVGIPVDFWEEGRRRLEALRPDIIMLSEGDRPDDQNYAFDLSYGFPWYRAVHRAFDGEAPASGVQAVWEKMHGEFPEGARFTRILDSHDIANDAALRGARYRFENRWGSPGVDAALALNFAVDGVPFVYNGLEAADTAVHNLWASRFTGGNCVIDWWKALTETGKARLAFIKELTELRHSLPALGGGRVQWLSHDAPERLVAFARALPEQRLFFAVNTGNEPLTAAIDLAAPAQAKALLSRAVRWAAGDGKISVELPAYGFLLLDVT